MSRLAKEAREQAQATGKLPHEILLDMARGRIEHLVPVKNERGELVRDAAGNQLYEPQTVVLDIDQRRDAAKAAAPYFAPKIGVVELVGNMPDAELDEIIRNAAHECGLDLAALMADLGLAPGGDDGDGDPDAEGGGEEAERTRPRIERKRAVRP